MLKNTAKVKNMGNLHHCKYCIIVLNHGECLLVEIMKPCFHGFCFYLGNFVLVDIYIKWDLWINGVTFSIKHG